MSQIIILFLPFLISLINSDDSNKYYKAITDKDIFAKYYPKAKEILKKMTDEEKIGQLLFPRYNKSNVLNEIKKYHFGGYVLFAVDFENNTKETMLKEIEKFQQASKIRLGLSVDEEGGGVTRISKYKAYRNERFPSPKDLYTQGGINKILEIEKEKIQLIKDVGLNINLAPVADFTTNTSGYIYNRTLGQDLDNTTDYIEKVVIEANKNNFTTCLKHFPGYGNNIDTHKDLAYDDRDLSEFQKVDFKPFNAGIKNNVPSILISHNIITKVDNKYPSSISGKIHKILREDLNFSGLMLTDDISMKAITKYSKNTSAATLAILSGMDVVLTSNNSQNYEEVLKDFKNGVISKEIVDNAVTRVLAWKLFYLGDNIVNHKSNVLIIVLIIIGIIVLGGIIGFIVFRKKNETITDKNVGLTSDF